MTKLFPLALALQLPVLIGPAKPLATANPNVLEVGSGQTYTTISACETAATAGQICNIHAGTYTETVIVNGPSGITFRNNAGDSPVLVGRFRLGSGAVNVTITCNRGGGQMEITGYGTVSAGASGGVEMISTSGATVTGCKIDNAYGAGLYARNSPKTTLVGNVIHDLVQAGAGISSTGITILSSASTDATYANGTTVSTNEIYNNGVDGMSIHGDYITVSENYIHDNITTDVGTIHPDGIQFLKTSVDGLQDVRHARVYNNVIKNHTQNIFIEGASNDSAPSTACTDIWIVNNVLTTDSGLVNGVDLSSVSTKGVAIYGCSNVYVYGNTIGQHSNYPMISSTAGGGFKNGDGTLHFKNNIVTNAMSPGVGLSISEAADFSAGELDYNQYFTTGNAVNVNAVTYATRALYHAAVPTQETNGQDGDPLINAMPTPTLQALSPAIDHGADLNGTCSLCVTDKAGVSRPIGLPWDIGAYQRVP